MSRASHPGGNVNRIDPAVTAQRREIVHTLHSQGMKPYAIMRYLRDNADLSLLLEGINHPYQMILRDIAAPRSMIRRHNVDPKETNESLHEVVGRLDEVYAEMWSAYNMRKGMGITDDTTLKYLEAAQNAALTKARIMGVAGDGPRTDVGLHQQNNVFIAGGNSAQDFLAQVQMAGRALNGGYIDGESTPVVTSGDEHSRNATVHE
jgi:hypothetical protein